MLYVLNVPVLTNYGTFRFQQISIKQAKEMLSKARFISAVGHKGTAELMTTLFELEIKFNRIEIEMKTGDEAIVFRLLKRMPEGVILSKDELEKLPYEIGLLERIS